MVFPTHRNWFLVNTDTGEEITGQFEAVGVTRNVKSNYSRKTALNRATPITQYLNGDADTLTFQGRIFRRDVLQGSGLLGPRPQDELQTLIAWTKRDPNLGRPPIVILGVGDGDPIYGAFFSVIDSISDIFYDSPVSTGAFRGATFTVDLSQYSEDFSVEPFAPPETRYARAKDGDYYELLAAEEYGQPLLGDIIRKRHPEKQIVQSGDVVKLPSLDAIRTIAIQPTSIALKGITSRRDSPQKTLREFHQERLNRTVSSVIVPAGF